MVSLFFVRRALPLLVVALSAGCSARPSGEAVGGDESDLTSHQVIQEGDELVVTASSLNLRASTSTNARVVAVLHKGDDVTCAATSGSNGWVSVTTSTGDAGWVSGTYLKLTSNAGSSTSSSSSSSSSSGSANNDLPTCDPDRAGGAVSSFEKALHDSIAFAEGTRGFADDGYNVMFSFKLFSDCSHHPNKCLAFGGSCSTAAGRYQFLTTTWNEVANAKGLHSFEPDNQERAGAYLISTIRHVTVPQNRPLTSAEFSNAMSKLSYEWASLPPGRYGQPNKTMSQLRSLYCSLAGC